MSKTDEPTPAEPVETITIETAYERERARAETLERILERTFPKDTRTLDERMACVQAELEDVPRRGHAEVQTRQGGKYTYDYILEADLMSGVRPLLAKHGIATYYSDELLRWSDGTAEVRVVMTFAANGQDRTCEAVGIGADMGDKAANKAKTSAVRYILWKTFLQPSDEDPEQENVTTDSAKAAATGRRTAADARAASTTTRRTGSKTPEQIRGELIARISQLSVEADEVQGKPAGRTLGHVQDLVTADFEKPMSELENADLVAVGQALAAFVTEERAKADAGQTADGEFALPRGA